MRNYQHLFFDLDHTLWDFEKNSAATLDKLYHECALFDLGIQNLEEFKQVYHEINDRLWDRFRKGFLSRADLRWKRMWQTLLVYKIRDEGLAHNMSERYLDILPTMTHVFPGCHQTLEACVQKGYDIHLITNGFEATQKQKLHHAGLSGYFQYLITSEQAMSMKPHPEIFEFALRETGADVKKSLMIGDALDIDIIGAHQVGMDQVFFNPMQIPHIANPTFEITHLTQLLEIL